MNKRGTRRVRVRRRESSFLKGALPRGKRERRRVEFLSGVAFIVFVLAAGAVFWASSFQQRLLRSPNIAAVVATVLAELANQDRAANDLGSLAVNPVLVAAAQAKANDMAEKGYFAHTSPEGLDPWHWFKEAGYAFDYAGENLAVDFSDSTDVNAAWMQSPTHRKNLLDPHYTEIGIATAQGMYQGRPTTFVVQAFGTPRGTGQQGATSSVVPDNPAEVAFATTQDSEENLPEPAVLGSASEEATVATTSPVLAARLAQESKESTVPLWGYLVSFPRSTVHFAFYLIALLVMLALLLDTGFELHEHHKNKAYRAATALAVVSVLFVLADFLFFSQPVLAVIAASL